MAFKLVIKPLVFTDADEAVLYYEKRLAGLGKRFYTVFLNSLSDIQNNPFNFSYIKDPVRRCKIKKFPYKIFYIVEGTIIFVIGLSHAKRSNAFVKRRLRLLE